MVKWIVIAVVVLGLVVLALAAMSVVRRLPNLDRAMRRLSRRQEEALRLQGDAEKLQENLLALQQKAEVATGQVAVIKAGRGKQETDPLRPDTLVDASGRHRA